MKSGKCPKCNASDVYMYKTGVRFGEHGGGDSFTVFSGDASHLSRYILYDSYVCANCGYFENYISDKAKLQEIQAKWTKVK